MAKHGESELIDNFIMELQPYLALIDQAVEELARPAPDPQVVNQATESLAIIRDASGVLAFAGLVALARALEDTIEDLLDSVTPDPDQKLVRARALSVGIHRYMDALADGHDTDELVSRVLAPFEAPFEELATEVVAEPHVVPVTASELDPSDFVAGGADPELREIFEEEATELVASFTRGALMLVSAPDRPTLLTGLRRDAHTIKGAANMTGFPLIGSVGASIETLLDAHIEGDVPVERETLGVVLSARKLLTGMLETLDDLVQFIEPARALNERANAITARIAPFGLPSAERDDELAADTIAFEQPAVIEAQGIEEPVELEPADIAIAVTDALSSNESTEVDAEADQPADVVHSVDTESIVNDLVEQEIESDTIPGVMELDEAATRLTIDVPADEIASVWDALEPTVPNDSADTPFVGIEPQASESTEPVASDFSPTPDGGLNLGDDECIPAAEVEPQFEEILVDEFVVDERLAAEDLVDEPTVDELLSEESPGTESPVDEPELDVYEIAAEIAMLARLRTSLQPQNAMFFPTDASDLTNHIDALTAEIVDSGAGDLTAVSAPLDAEAAGDPESISEEVTPIIDRIDRVQPPPITLAGMAQDEELLGHALLDLAFETSDAPEIIRPVIADTFVSDERMQQELRETFAVEAAEHADSLTLAAMALERDPESVDALRELTRVLHTLKGAAAAAGFDEIGERCHAIEDNLAAGTDIDRAFTDQVLELASQIEQATGVERLADMLVEDAATTEPAQAPARTAGDLRVEMRRLDGLLNLVGELVINRSTLDQRLQRLSASLDELGHMTDRLRRSGQTLERVAGEASLFGPLPLPGDNRIVAINDHALRHEFDTLEMDRYTDLDVLARELGEVASDIAAVAGEVRNLRGDFETVSTHQRRLTNDIQDELMDIRMVPLATLSPLLHRVVRRVANECGKDVDLVIEGSEIAFDKALVDALSDALLHLLRNAVDHGIEPVAVRTLINKPAHGRIVVRAWQDRGNAVVEVIDDGGGIDTARLVERARAYGFITAEHVSEAEALQLMFLPGFTTRDSANSISGRGVGLDAVREAVERVKGRVTVDTKPGAGTIFQLRLPVMLAVAQAFLVEAGGRRYAVPLADVDFVADRRQAKLSRVGNAALVEINDAVIPAIDLATRLAGDSDRLNEETGWLLVTRSGGEARAMRVDALDGQQEIVVKPLGRYLSAAPGVTGATILGDGQIALIIDVTEVTSKRLISEPAAQPTSIDSGHPGVGTALIVDDSLSVRRVLARTLERHGWTTIQAHDGVEALEMVQTGGIDIVVTDIEMPRMDGFELINSLRRGGWQTLPVVVLTSRSSSKHRDKAIELGANAYIVKPFQEQELLQTLERETVAIRVAG